MPEPDDEVVIETMERYGGAFVQTLARLYRVADPLNRARVRHAFGDYFEEYRALAARRREHP
jgi:hypothetical protein